VGIHLLSVFFDNLFISEAAFDMIIHCAGCLHVCINNCRADKFESIGDLDITDFDVL
jgi:hypothetical protein